MSFTESRPSRRWPGTVERTAWAADDRTYAALLDGLATEMADVQAVEIERLAHARRDMADIKEDEQHVRDEEMSAARRELNAFRDALEDVRVRGGRGTNAEVSYDASDHDQDVRSDVLIQYLVRPGYGEVRTEEPEPGQYVYYIRVDWDRLRDLADRHGHPLPG